MLIFKIEGVFDRYTCKQGEMMTGKRIKGRATGVKVNQLKCLCPKFISFVIIIGCCFFYVNCALAVVFVDQDRPGGNGTSWASAYKTLDAAIAGSGSNQEFWIAEGVYSPGGTLEPAAGSTFYGGFTGNEVSRNTRNISAHPTVIDGQSVLIHVFYIHWAGVRLDGLVMQGGNASGVGNDGTGGGVFVNRVATVFDNCTFRNNVAASGGALYGYESDITVNSCLFDSNQANYGEGRGGAIWLHKGSPEIVGSTFSNNSAANMGGGVELNNTPGALISGSIFFSNQVSGAGGGGAVSLQWDGVSPEPSATIEGCKFQNNSSGLEGGAVYSNQVHVTVKQSDFIGNSAANGGALMLDYKLTGAADKVERCLFLNNRASSIGGAIRSYARSMDISNSIFAYNFSANSAGAVGFHAGNDADNNSSYSVRISNSTFWGNEAIVWGGAIQNSKVLRFYLYNCILWNNKGGEPHWGEELSNDVSNSGSSTMTTRYTDMESLDWHHGSVWESHTGSFSSNPLFVDPDGADNIAGTQDDNFQLQATSPCIDRADGDKATACDMDCFPRVDQSGTPNQGIGSPVYADIGALERIAGTGVQPCSSCSVALPVVPIPPQPPAGNVTIPPIMHMLLGK